jgi:VanZ family protein
MTALLSRHWRQMFGIAFVIGIGTLVVLSIMPGNGGTLQPPWDKAQHGAAYAVVTATAAMAFPWRLLIVVGMALFGLGLALEVAQTFVAGRYGSIGDGVANGIGIAAVMAVAFLSRRKR